MKKTFIALVAVVFALSFTSCNKMEKDAKDYAKKTCKCLSMTDVNDPNSFENEDFLKCSAELDKLDSAMQRKYSSDEDRQKFTELYLDELMNSDLPNEWKEWFKMLASFNEDGGMDMTGDDALDEEPMTSEIDADAE